eukprot:scaffold81088_cov18-Phaeocystis_antarctica.AAC.1
MQEGALSRGWPAPPRRCIYIWQERRPAPALPPCSISAEPGPEGAMDQAQIRLGSGSDPWTRLSLR